MGKVDGVFYGVCYGQCEWGSADCKLDDTVYYQGKLVGIAFLISGKTVYVFSLDVRQNITWYEAVDYVKSYVPKGLENIPELGAGKWMLSGIPWNSRTWASSAYLCLTGISKKLGYNYPTGYLWSHVESKSDGSDVYDLADVRLSYTGALYTSKNNKANAAPVITFIKP